MLADCYTEACLLFVLMNSVSVHLLPLMLSFTFPETVVEVVVDIMDNVPSLMLHYLRIFRTILSYTRFSNCKNMLE